MIIGQLNHCLEEAFQKPLLSISDIEQYRVQMSYAFKTFPPHIAAFYLGCQSATPGMAFLSGYQSAIRCLDVSCPSAEFAAFCVSEKGVKKPWDMETELVGQGQGWILNGRKGFVMLLPDIIDQLYILAKEKSGGLTCVKIDSNSQGVSVSSPLNAPFVKDIPHAGIELERVAISDKQVLSTDAHEAANKPFRYWEDIHVATAMFAWMLRQMRNRSDFELQKSEILEKICQLFEKFTQQPQYYSIEGLKLLNECHDLLEKQSQNLPESAMSLWKIDRLLMQMGYKIRGQISKKLK